MCLLMEGVKAVIAWMVWSRIGKWDKIPEKSRFKRKVIKQEGNNNQSSSFINHVNWYNTKLSMETTEWWVNLSKLKHQTLEDYWHLALCQLV